MNRSLPRLITIPVSHYCEKVRWALDWLGIDYIEEPHAPLFHRLATGRQGGKSVPVLVTQSGALTDSTDILHYLDTIAPEEKLLYPAEPQLRQQVEEWEDLFDKHLGVCTRCWGYFYGLGDGAQLQQAWGQGAPGYEKIALELLLPMMRAIVRRAYQPTAAGAAEAYRSIKSIFDRVSEQFTDNRLFLVGERLSAADISFAALAAPILLPKQHPMTAMQTKKIPSTMLQEIQQCRKTPAGQYGLRLYRECRRPSGC